MSNLERITLYAAPESPYPHRVRLALEEAHADYEVIWISLSDKPEWYAKKVYPEARVPYLVYGGPKLNPDESPSPDSVQIPESLIILEFLVDILPSAKLLPADPALRTKARLFIQVVETKLLTGFIECLFKGNPAETLLEALESIQRMLPPEGHAVGEWSIADAALAPYLMQVHAIVKLNPATLQEGVAEQITEALRSPRFERLHKYLHDNIARPSMAKTWDEATVLKSLRVRLEAMTQATQASAPHV